MWKDFLDLLGPMGGAWKLRSARVSMRSIATANRAGAASTWRGLESISQLTTFLRLCVLESLNTPTDMSVGSSGGSVFGDRWKVSRVRKDRQN
jgi:hypothetical protein